jgi:hypothetical protein
MVIRVVWYTYIFIITEAVTAWHPAFGGSSQKFIESKLHHGGEAAVNKELNKIFSIF